MFFFNTIQIVNRMLLCILSLTILSCGVSCSPEKQKTPIAQLIVTTEPENAVLYIYGKERGKNLRVRPGTYILRFSCETYKDVWVKAEVKAGQTVRIHQIMEQEKSDVVLVSIPDKAQVTFRNKNLGLTPVVIQDLPHGDYTAELRLAGYASRSASWTVNSDTPQLVKVNLISNTGILKITSNPAKSEVFLDGRLAGLTPFSGSVEAGRHKIEIRRPGYQSVVHQIIVSRDKQLVMPCVNLEIKRGGIDVESTPSAAQIQINGKNYGDTPGRIRDLLPGTYKVCVKKDGYDSEERTITVRPGAVAKVHVPLDSNTGGLHIVTQPAGLTLYVDGKLVGITQADPDNKGFSRQVYVKKLCAGKHKLTVYHKRGRPKTRKNYEFIVRKGQIYSMKNVSMWIPNVEVIFLQDNSRKTGRLTQELKNSYRFEPEPGVSYSLRKNEVKINYLKD